MRVTTPGPRGHGARYEPFPGSLITATVALNPSPYPRACRYYDRITQSIDGLFSVPEKIQVSIIYDFMDQAKTATPQFKRYRQPKGSEGGNQRIFRIMGVKVHGHGLFLYYVDETHPKGADIVCTLVCDVQRRCVGARSPP